MACREERAQLSGIIRFGGPTGENAGSAAGGIGLGSRLMVHGPAALAVVRLRLYLRRAENTRTHSWRLKDDLGWLMVCQPRVGLAMQFQRK